MICKHVDNTGVPDIPPMVLADNLGKNSICLLRRLFDVKVP